MSGVSPINAGNVEPKTPVKTPVKSATPIKQQSFAAAEKEEGMSTTAKMIGGAVLVGIGATAAYFLTKGKNKAALEEATKKADEAKKALDELKAKMPNGGNKTTQQVTEAGNVGEKAAEKAGVKTAATNSVSKIKSKKLNGAGKPIEVIYDNGQKLNWEYFKDGHPKTVTITNTDGTTIVKKYSNSSHVENDSPVVSLNRKKQTLVSDNPMRKIVHPLETITTTYRTPNQFGFRKVVTDGNGVLKEAYGEGVKIVSTNNAGIYKLNDKTVSITPEMFKNGEYAVVTKKGNTTTMIIHGLKDKKETGSIIKSKVETYKTYRNGLEMTTTEKFKNGVLQEIEIKEGDVTRVSKYKDGDQTEGIITSKNGTIKEKWGKDGLLERTVFDAQNVRKEHIVFKNGQAIVSTPDGSRVVKKVQENTVGEVTDQILQGVQYKEVTGATGKKEKIVEKAFYTDDKGKTHKMILRERRGYFVDNTQLDDTKFKEFLAKAEVQ